LFSPEFKLKFGVEFTNNFLFIFFIHIRGDVQVWDSIQGLCSYIRGMLSSQAILSGLLPDNQGASATAGSAFMTFFMRDISGMLGGVLFAAIQVPSSQDR
jgi:hypothetical protein